MYCCTQPCCAAGGLARARAHPAGSCKQGSLCVALHPLRHRRYSADMGCGPSSGSGSSDSEYAPGSWGAMPNGVWSKDACWQNLRDRCGSSRYIHGNGDLRGSWRCRANAWVRRCSSRVRTASRCLLDVHCAGWTTQFAVPPPPPVGERVAQRHRQRAVHSGRDTLPRRLQQQHPVAGPTWQLRHSLVHAVG